MRNSWTDDRLDDFKSDVNARFDRVDVRFDQIDARFDKVDARFDKVDARFEKVERRMDLGFAEMRVLLKGTDERVDALQRTLIQVGAGLIGVMLVGILTLVGAQIS